jgi:hypothetical protein
MATKHKVITTDAEIRVALEQAKQLKDEARIVRAKYLPTMQAFVFQLNDGTLQAIAKDKLEGLQSGTRSQLSKIELLGNGTALHWPDLDVDIYVPLLLKGIYGTGRWMAEIGRQGGSVQSDAKRVAARANGAKGGRPRKTARC